MDWRGEERQYLPLLLSNLIEILFLREIFKGYNYSKGGGGGERGGGW